MHHVERPRTRGSAAMESAFKIHSCGARTFITPSRGVAWGLPPVSRILECDGVRTNGCDLVRHWKYLAHAGVNQFQPSTGEALPLRCTLEHTRTGIAQR